MIHDFNERLAYSEAASDDPFWEKIYRKAFPDFISMMGCYGDTKSQRMGIDRIVALASGRILKIDEKKRDAVYDDILLEYLSNDITNAPGWIAKPLQIDYLAYAFMPVRTAYVLPWDMLRRTWLYHGERWLNTYRRQCAKNRGYNTWFIAVPIKELLMQIKSSMVIEL